MMSRLQFVASYHLLLLCSLVFSSAAINICTVSFSSGHDGLECGNSTSPCRTLDYTLSHVQGCNTVTVLGSQTLYSSFPVESPRNLTIVGDVTKKSYIYCKNNSGIVFISPNHVRLENLHFVSCAARHNYSSSEEYSLVEYAAVYFFRGNDVQIVGCDFSNGSGAGVIMHDVVGNNNLLKESRFTGNKPGRDNQVTSITTFGGVLIKRMFVPGVNATYRIENCNFTENENVNSILGGGLTLYLAASRSNSTVVISDSYFVRNSGKQGGGVFINLSGASLTDIAVTGSHFLNNAASQGGGIFLNQIKAASESLYSCSLYLNLSFFYENSAEWGGGLAVYNGNSHGNSHGYINVQAYRSYWTANKAETSGFAVGFSMYDEAKDRPSKDTAFLLNALFERCIFRSNNYNTTANLASVGAVVLMGSKAEFRNSSFSYTYGTALYLIDSSYAAFSGNTSFSFNSFAIQGGAIYIDRLSLIAVKYDTAPANLLFRNNSAIMEGGAIYLEEVGGLDTKSQPCVFESLGSLLNSSEKVVVNFSYNLANHEYRAIFIGSPENCVNGKEEKNLLFDNPVFSYHPNQQSQVASTASIISLDSNPKPTSTEGGKYLKVMLGELFYLVPNVTDMFHNIAQVSGNLELVSQSDTGRIKLVGPNFIGLDNFTQNNELFITGSQDVSNDLSLHFIYKEQSNYHKGDVKLNIDIVPCRIGFQYNATLRICQCNPLGNLLKCPLPRSHACVRYGYWYGQYNQTAGKPIPCPEQNCNYAYGNCPQTGCPADPDFCLLEKDDDLCWNGRGGLLCSSCRENYSFTFGALECAPSHTCPPGITALITIGVIVYWILFVVFVLVILSLDLSIGSGFMYGIIYYFSVLNLYSESTVTEFFLSAVINTCTALTQLSPRAFGNINVCFVQSWNLNLHHKLFHFVSPVFVITVVVVVILASRYCRCPRMISLAENSPIHAICMLVLFSYTCMVYTIFYILRPIEINGEWRVFVDPHLRYFHKDHLPYAIVALLCEFLITLPVCFLLLFAPWLSRRVNLVKLRLKPILDEFQACYHPRYRWFAGLYFLARQLVFLASAIQELPQSNFILRCTNALILIVHSTFQPYKLKWLNFLDTFLLMDIFLLSVSSLDWSTSFLHRAIPYILILPPSIYLYAVILLILFKRAFYCLISAAVFKNLIRRIRRSKRPTELPSRVHSVTSTVVDVDENHTPSDPEPRLRSLAGSGFFDDYGEREPLLTDTNPEETTSSRSSGRSSQAYTTTSLRIENPVSGSLLHPDKFSTA